MKIIILGAGQVGGSLTEALIKENHDITLVDVNEQLLRDLADRLDIRTVIGHCSYPDVLRQAGADEADLLIAVTDSDESNMVACQVAYSLFQTPTKIARIRSQHYLVRKELFGRDNVPIDVFISPEQLVTNTVAQLIMHPGALQVLTFGHGLVKLAAVKPYYGGVLLGKTIDQINEYLPDIHLRIVAIFRNDRSIDIKGDTEIEIGDEIFFVAASHDVDQMLSALRRAQPPYKKIFIVGGGNIGACLAAQLQHDYQVKLIEHNRKRCHYLADKLAEVIVLCGEASDEELLLNENIERADVFVALTNDDEANIIASIQAKRLGVKQVMTLITRTAYVDLIEGGSINIAISPQQVTVGSILAHIRRGDVKSVHALRRGAAEVIEAVAHGDRKTSRVIGRRIAKLRLPSSVTVGAILRQQVALIPDDETVIESEDHVILFVANKKHIPEVEKLFQVSAGFF